MKGIEIYMNNVRPHPMAAPGIYETILSLLPKSNRKKLYILDAGAGSGSLSQLLGQNGFQVSACDINPKQFVVEGVLCKKADLNHKIPYASGMFDYVISPETIEHLEDPWQFFREAHRVLKPKGTVIVSTPNVTHISSRVFYLLFGTFIPFWSRRYMEFNWHIHPIFHWTLAFMLEHTGFTILRRTYSQGKLFPVFKIFFKRGKLYFGSPVSISYLPKNDLFGENIIVSARKNG